MKMSFRVWKQNEAPLNAALAALPNNLTETDKMNMLLAKWLNVSKPSPAAPEWFCLRKLEQHVSPQQQVVVCQICHSKHFEKWRACQTKKRAL